MSKLEKTKTRCRNLGNYLKKSKAWSLKVVGQK